MAVSSPAGLTYTGTTIPIGSTAADKSTDKLTPNNVDSLASLAGLMSGLQGTQVLATGQATAARTIAEGADAEAAAYTTAGDIAEENARIAGIAGDISLVQQQRAVAAAGGQISAGAGAGGVIESGNVLDVMRASYQQGAIGAQMLTVQTALEVGGHEEQAAATDAEVAAAQAQRNAALAEADAYTSQASLAASQTSQLQSLYDKQLTDLSAIEADPTKNMDPNNPNASTTTTQYRPYTSSPIPVSNVLGVGSNQNIGGTYYG